MEHFTGVFQKDGKWWVAHTEELPGANTQGRTLKEARENLKEAIELILDANRDLARRLAKGKRVIREQIQISAAE